MIYNVLVGEPDNDTWTSIANGVRRYQAESAIVRVKDGEQAVRYLFQRGLLTEEPETPHLILLAAHLPIVSMNAVIARLRQHPRTQAIPVIVIRRDAGRDEAEEGLESELGQQLEPGVVEILATARLEKDVASALTQLHRVAAPKVTSAPCSPL
ncbi:hypothetical protein [Steroidobacter cummioxidans]|uniref:hypothetical protein n=1 Tax=Steroidobacter cummioxidans TaxID=1803913 RepID=UPI00137A3AC0|nr:hypothetical protein [Steroidobacter cummioxidans]